MIPGDIITAAKSMMAHLTTVSDGGPAQFKVIPAGIPLERCSFDKGFEVLADKGNTRGLTGIAGRTWRWMRLVVRVIYFNEGRSSTDNAILLVQDAQRLQEALCYLIRQLGTSGYSPGSIAAIPGVETCTIEEEWTLERLDNEQGAGAHILTIPLRVDYVDDVSTS